MLKTFPVQKIAPIVDALSCFCQCVISVHNINKLIRTKLSFSLKFDFTFRRWKFLFTFFDENNYFLISRNQLFTKLFSSSYKFCWSQRFHQNFHQVNMTEMDNGHRLYNCFHFLKISGFIFSVSTFLP